MNQDIIKSLNRRNHILLRPYQSLDCQVLAELFYDTVHTINIKDYSTEQVEAWANGVIDLENWNTSFLAHYTIIAEINHKIVGFGDIDKTGYLNRLYIHSDFQHQGIATAICNILEQSIKTSKITTHASITARGFFEKRGYKVIKKQQVQRHHIFLTNYLMTKTLK